MDKADLESAIAASENLFTAYGKSKDAGSIQGLNAPTTSTHLFKPVKDDKILVSGFSVYVFLRNKAQRLNTGKQTKRPSTPHGFRLGKFVFIVSPRCRNACRRLRSAAAERGRFKVD